jgi:hypothetical protein
MTDSFDARLRYNGVQVRNLNGVVASNGIVHGRIVEAARFALAGTPTL